MTYNTFYVDKFTLFDAYSLANYGTHTFAQFTHIRMHTHARTHARIQAQTHEMCIFAHILIVQHGTMTTLFWPN